MKNAGKILVAVAFTGLVLSANAQEDCDTLKWKAIKTYYSVIDGTGTSFDVIGDLDGATINIDTLSAFYPVLEFVNVSNDTFAASGTISLLLYCYFYADTGIVASTFDAVKYPNFYEDVLPNDTIGFVYAKEFNIQFFVNQLKTQSGMDLEQISYWKMIMGVWATSRDGYYSKDVFYAGADTATFYVVRGNNAIAEIEKPSIISVYPNPTTGLLRVVSGDISDSGDRVIKIYNVAGQVVFTSPVSALSPETIIDISHLTNGMYFLKVDNKMFKIIKN